MTVTLLSSGLKLSLSYAIERERRCSPFCFFFCFFVDYQTRGRSSPLPELFGGKAREMRGRLDCKVLSMSSYRASSCANAAGTALTACKQYSGDGERDDWKDGMG